jgi:hypothetical protein
MAAPVFKVLDQSWDSGESAGWEVASVDCESCFERVVEGFFSQNVQVGISRFDSFNRCRHERRGAESSFANGR